MITINTWRDPYDAGFTTTKPKQVSFQPGLTVLVGCNGAGKSTLLMNIKEEVAEQKLPCHSYDNLVDGGNHLGAILGGYGEEGDDLALGVSLFTSSEGEEIKGNISRESRLYKSFLELGYYNNRDYKLRRIFKDKDEDEKKLEPIKKSEKQEKDKTEDKKKVPKEKPPKEKVPKPEKPKKEKPEKPKKEKPEKPKKEKPKLEFFKKKADKEEDKEKDKTKIDPVPPPVPVPESVPVPDPIPVPPSVPVPQPVPVPEPVPKQVSIPEPKQEEPPKLEPIKPEPKQEEPLKLEPKVEESTTVVSEVKSNKPEPQKKPSLFGRRKEKEIPHLSRLNVFVSGIDHSVGTSYVAGSLASAITDIYDVDVWFDHKGMCSIPDNYMVHEVTDEVDRFNAFKSGIIVQDKGVYNELSIMDRNEMMHADMNIMVSTAEEMDLQKIAQFIGLQGKLIQNWMFVFNHVLDHQKHILESAMKDYAYIIIPFHDNAEVPEELLAEWKDAIDYFTK